MLSVLALVRRAYFSSFSTAKRNMTRVFRERFSITRNGGTAGLESVLGGVVLDHVDHRKSQGQDEPQDSDADETANEEKVEGRNHRAVVPQPLGGCHGPLSDDRQLRRCAGHKKHVGEKVRYQRNKGANWLRQRMPNEKREPWLVSRPRKKPTIDQKPTSR